MSEGGDAPAWAAVRAGALRVGAAIALIAALAAGRAAWSGQAEWHAAEAALAQADVDTAIVHLRRAASWALPWGPHVTRALDRLAELGARAEAAGNIAQALAAERAIRAAIMSGRSFVVSHAERLARADARIARLSQAGGAVPSVPPRGAADLSLGFSLLALAGWIGWTGAAGVLVTRGVDARSRLVPVWARRALIALVLGFGAFALGLAFA